MKITLACSTCRKYKRTQLDMYDCKHREGEFNLWSKDAVCEQWLPSINDLRLWIKLGGKRT